MTTTRGGRLVVVGLPELGAILSQGYCEAAFAEVSNLGADSGPGGRLALAEAMQGRGAEDLAFVFCDIVAPGLRPVATGLARAGHRVVLLTGAASGDLEDVATLHLEFSPNDVLAALSQLPGVGFLPPAEGLDDLFSDAADAGDEPAVAPAAQSPAAGTWAEEPDDDADDGWSRPTADIRPGPEAVAADPPGWGWAAEADADGGLEAPDLLAGAADPEPAGGDWWSRPGPARPVERSLAAVVDFDVAVGSARSQGRPTTSPRRPSSRRSASADGPGRVVAFTCPKGGTGKSSTCLALASYLGSAGATSGRSVVVVDANVQQADASRYLRQPHSSSIADLVGLDPLSIDERTLAGVLVRDDENHMTLLFGPPTVAESDPTVVTPALYARVITVLRGMFDWVFVDTPVAEKHHDLFESFVLPEADRLVVVVNPSHVTVENASRWLTAIADPVYAGGNAYPRAGVRILLNKAEEGIGADTAEVAALLGEYTFVGAIPESPAWRSAANNGELLAGDARLGAVFTEVLHGITDDSTLLGRRHARQVARGDTDDNGHAPVGRIKAWAARQRAKAELEDAAKAERKSRRRER